MEVDGFAGNLETFCSSSIIQKKEVLGILSVVLASQSFLDLCRDRILLNGTMRTASSHMVVKLMEVGLTPAMIVTEMKVCENKSM